MQTLTFPRSQSLTIQWTVNLVHVMNDIHIPSPCRLNNTQCSFQRGIQTSSHPRLLSSLGQHNFSAYTASLLHSHINFRYLKGSLTPTQKFRISPRVFYTHTEISDFSTGLLHPHRNLGRLPGSLTPTQKFWISPRVSYTHTEIQDISPGLLHPHINTGYLPGSLTPIQKFGISPRVSYTLTPGFSP